jgi:hypothetical protein
MANGDEWRVYPTVLIYYHDLRTYLHTHTILYHIHTGCRLMDNLGFDFGWEFRSKFAYVVKVSVLPGKYRNVYEFE